MLKNHVALIHKVIFAPKLMRVVAEIPHSHFKIQIFNWNGKFLLKFEIDQYEQTYKVSESNVNGLEDIKSLVTEEFLEKVMERMLTMRTDWNDSLKSILS